MRGCRVTSIRSYSVWRLSVKDDICRNCELLHIEAFALVAADGVALLSCSLAFLRFGYSPRQDSLAEAEDQYKSSRLTIEPLPFFRLGSAGQRLLLFCWKAVCFTSSRHRQK
jgi:hypothetical protein